MFDLKIKVGHSDLHFMVQRPSLLYLEDLAWDNELVCWVFDLKIKVNLSDLFFIVQYCKCGSFTYFPGSIDILSCLA